MHKSVKIMRGLHKLILSTNCGDKTRFNRMFEHEQMVELLLLWNY